ncbi:MAG: glycosyltransferase family 4 protein [Bacteroidales bacterium]|nr:glycosyltransferase family 4 protein [Bacteroidales bacterium]
MKVLFVSGGNTEKFGIPPLVEAQGDSLKKEGIKIDYFPLVGKGLSGYLKNVLKLKKHLKNNPADIIHAHYSYSGVVAHLASKKMPIVVSLLGTDVNGKGIIKKLIISCIRFLSWDTLIVKSVSMQEKLKQSQSYIIPNGVNTELFDVISKEKSRNELHWDKSKKYILFAANPDREEKNFSLTQKAVSLLNNKNVELKYLDNIIQTNMPVWLNAADVVVLSSLWEGSPNVIKEAMACNCPIVATNVGDIEWLFGNEPGHYLATFAPEDFANKINKALDFAGKYNKTNGRKRLLALGLESETIAKKIIAIYKSIL